MGHSSVHRSATGGKPAAFGGSPPGPVASAVQEEPFMANRFEDRVVLITGGASGIGAAAARR